MNFPNSEQFQKRHDVGLVLTTQNPEELLIRRKLIINEPKETTVMIHHLFERARAVVVEIGCGIFDALECRDFEKVLIAKITRD